MSQDSKYNRDTFAQSIPLFIPRSNGELVWSDRSWKSIKTQIGVFAYKSKFPYPICFLYLEGDWATPKYEQLSAFAEFADHICATYRLDELNEPAIDLKFIGKNAFYESWQISADGEALFFINYYAPGTLSFVTTHSISREYKRYYLKCLISAAEYFLNRDYEE